MPEHQLVVLLVMLNITPALAKPPGKGLIRANFEPLSAVINAGNHLPDQAMKTFRKIIVFNKSVSLKTGDFNRFFLSKIGKNLNGYSG